VRSRHLASKLLGLTDRRLPDDWLARYGYRPVLLETFVEKARFRGTCYRDANWQYLGDTRCHCKLDTTHACPLPVKSVRVLPLTSRFRQHLISQTIFAPPAHCLISSGAQICIIGSTPNLSLNHFILIIFPKTCSLSIAHSEKS